MAAPFACKYLPDNELSSFQCWSIAYHFSQLEVKMLHKYWKIMCLTTLSNMSPYTCTKRQKPDWFSTRKYEMSSNRRFISLPTCLLAHYDVFVEDTDLSKNLLYALQNTSHIKLWGQKNLINLINISLRHNYSMYISQTKTI